MRAALDFLPRQLRARPLACFAACFLLGLLAGQGLAAPVWLPCGALALAVGAWIALRRRRRAAAVALVLAGLLAGMARMSLATDLHRLQPTQYSVPMVGRVASEPYLNPDTGRVIVRFRLESKSEEPSRLALRLYLRGDETLLGEVDYGQRLSLTGHIWAADPVTNPYEFDFGAYLLRQGFDGYATAKIEDVQILGASRDVGSLVIGARRSVGSRIDALFGQSAGLMRALVLGDRSQLSDELRQALNRSGTAHLISISGLHVTLLAALMSLLLRRVTTRRRANLIAATLLIPYGALIGFTAPFVRALVMFAILCFAPAAGRPSDSVTRLGAAMLLYLLIKPLDVSDAGFALSYAATAGIVLLMPPLSRLLGVEALRHRKPSPKRLRRLAHRAALYVPEALCASLAAQLATLPYVIAYFGVQSVVSLPFNLICVPLCMLAYVLGLGALALSFLFMPLAAALAALPAGLFALLTAITRYGGSLPVASVRIGHYPEALVALHWLVTLAASDLSRLRAGLRRFLPLSLMLVAALSTLIVFAGSWRHSVVFLDAGQADCAVVRTRGRTYLVDAGDTYTPAADYLNATCLRLDGVLLSHPHQDHAGGLSSVLENFRPGAIYVPRGWFEVEEVAPEVTEGIDAAREMGVPIIELSAGDSLELSPTARLEVFSPSGNGIPDEVNDLSMLALIECEGQRTLFTGDLSAEGEPDFIPDADVLKVAHHGSSKASSLRFLDACTPGIAVISVGENNYGHPADETLEKLAAVGAEVCLTRERGAVTLTLRDGQWHIDTYLEASDELE